MKSVWKLLRVLGLAWLLMFTASCHSTPHSGGMQGEVDTLFFPVSVPFKGEEINFFVTQCQHPAVRTLHFEEELATVVVVAEGPFLEQLKVEYTQFFRKEDCACD